MDKTLLRNLDKPLLITVFLIFIIGLCLIFSAAYSQGGLQFKITNLVLRQVIWMAFALVISFIIVTIDYQKLVDWAYVLYALTLFLLALVLAVGHVKFGAQRWFGIGVFTLQPSELAKIAFILALSFHLGYKAKFSYRPGDLLVPIIITIPFFILIFMQPDLGTASILIPVLLAMLFIRGVDVKHLLLLIATGILSLPILWSLLKDYQRERLMVFINPNIDPLGAGYTVIQSKIAIGSGMFFGKGWLSGTQNQLNFLPERHTDFIFSVMGEEWGFLGSSILIILYIILIYRGLKIAYFTTDSYGKLTACGIVTMLAFQIIVNIGMTMGLMPIVGLPLPLLSYGGSSLLTTMISISILLNIGMRRPRF